MTGVLSLIHNEPAGGCRGAPCGACEGERGAEDQAHREEQLLQAQRLETIGTLASGVAHDLNNLLTAILCCAAVMRSRADRGADTRAPLEQIEHAARSASQLAKRLLDLGRGQEARRKPVDVRDVVGEVVALLEHALDKRIRIEFAEESGSTVVLGVSSQIEQVLLNLAVNAADAMPQGGLVRFATRRQSVSSDAGARSLGLSPGQYVVIEVTDDGAGVPEELRRHIFEPFFTTKPQGKGTGMGLAVASRIAASHDGTILLASAPGRPTTFSLYLPAAAAGRSRNAAA